jgi:hypothetical protein
MIEIDRNPSEKNLRWFGLVLGLFLAIVGGIVRVRFHLPEAARWIWIAAMVVTVVYYAARPVRRPIWIAWMVAAFPIGWMVSHLILAITWYLVVTPIGVVMRATGRDPLRRRFDQGRSSYWTEHDPHGDPKRYFRQF